jgi:hypothetical protein
VDTFAYGYNYFHFKPKPAQIYIWRIVFYFVISLYREVNF